jgi:hypothetical protein
MLKSKSAQWFSESYESARFPQLTKEHGADPYLRAAKILRLRPNPCNLRVMPRPKARNSAETICGSSNDESEKYFSPKIDGQN